MLSHNLPIKIEPQQNEAYNTKFKTNIVWKQLFKNPHLVNGNNWSGNAAYGTVAVADNKLTYTITTKNANQAITQPSISFTQNHIYLLSCWLTVSEDQVVGCYTGNSVTNLANVKANARTRIFNVFKSNITSTRTCYIYPARNGGLPIGGTAILEDACLYDLTEMFGEGKEMLGRFSFLSNFPNNYYDYNVDGDLVPFTIPVYGGVINIKTGLLQITKYNIDLGYLYWQYSAAQASTGKYRKACTEVLFEATSSTSDEPDLISSGYQTLSNAVSYQFTQGIAIATNSTIYICDERYSLQNDMPTFANAVKGITACGVMPSPVTYNLTPVEIKTLLGNNKISSNATELRLIYKNSQNEILLCGGSNEYSITDGVFNRNVLASTNLFSPKQNLNGWTYPYFSGLGPIKLDFEPVQGSVSGIDYDTTQRVYGDNFVLLDSHGNAPSASSSLDVTIPVRNGNFYNQGSSTLSISIPTAHWPDRQVTLDNLMLYVKLLNEEMGIQDAIFIFDLNEPISFTDTLTNNNKIAYVEITLLKKDTETFLPVFLPLNIQYDYSDTVTPVNYNVLPVPHYTNICPIEGYTESLVTVEGDRVPDSESERRLKAITRPVFQWDFGLKLKFEGFTFADGTLCQFDNKITAYSLNATIENNECTIPYQLLDENCQGDIVAYINVSGNNYDVVVYEVYIPVIKRPKPENFLRPAIDLPSAVIASFADGADNVALEKLKIAVTPKQDLHGYDYPWVGGGGKNKYDNSIASATKPSWYTGTWSGSSFNNQNGITQTRTYNDGGAGGFSLPSLPSGTYTISMGVFDATRTYRCHISVTTTGSDMSVVVNNLTMTISGSRAYISFTVPTNMGVAVRPTTNGALPSGTTSYDFTDIQIEQGSSPTSYAPYSNICPITGYTEANATRTGKNLFDLNYLTATGITIADGVVSGTAATFHTNFGGTAGGVPIPVLPQGQLTLSFDVKTDGNASTSGNGIVVRFHYTDNTWTGIMKANNATEYSHEVMTSTANKVVDYIYISYSSTGSNLWYFKNFQLESSATETIYESYKGQTYNIPFSFEGQNIFTREGETEDRYLNGNGAEGTSSNYCISAYIGVEENKRYVFDASMTNLANTVFHAFYDAEKTQIEVTSAIQEGFIAPSNAKYIRLSYRKDAGASDFHISIGTVPHGTLNVKTGILNVDYAYISDLSNYFFSRGSSTYTYIFTSMPLTNMKVPTEASGRLEGIASSGYRISLTTGVNAYFTPYAMLRNSSRLYFRNDDYNNDATSFRASLSGQQAIYELETPCVYQLTPHEVKTLLGYNNIWVDTGEVEVSYYADPYLHFID